MAEKGFGVKEINLIGPSGTPTIESPNNLNLNSNNVAISTNVSIGGTLSVTGNVSVGGTLTYEDVTNIDSIGIITARDHVVVGGGLSVVGISTLSNIVKIMSGLDLQTNGTLDIIGSTSSSGLDIQSNASVQIGQNGFPNNDYATFTNTGVNLKYNGSTKLATTNTGVTVTGTLAATAVTGDGSGLSNLPAASPSTSDVQVAYELTNSSSSGNGWRINGNGIVNTTGNPDLYLIRGQKYRFINNSGGSHPFQIREASGGTAYSTGVTNNGASSGNIDFAPTYDSPAQLVYQCTSHGGMVGNIYLRDAAGNNTNIGITTFSGFVNVNGNFGLATSSPVAQTDSSGTALTPVLDLKGTGSIANESGVLQLTRKDNATQGSMIYNSGEDAGLTMRNTDGNGFGFYNGTTLALRSDSNGKFTAIGDKDSSNAQQLNNTASTNPEGCYIKFTNAAPNAQSRHFIKCSDNVGDKAVIDSNGNSRNLNNSYGGFSDISLKENIVDAGSQWDDIKNIKVRVFNFKVDSASDKRIGVVAQEIETVCPKLVGITSDKDVDGNLLETGVKSVKYSVLYMKAIKALQEAMIKIENLEAEVAALKAK